MSRLNDLSDLRSRLSRIVSTEHQNTGQWTTSQIFYHLAAAFEGSVEGLPQGYPALSRAVIQPFRKQLIRLRFPPWLPIPKAIASKLDPPREADLQQQYERLLAAIYRFEAKEGSLPPHPVLGPFNKEEWTQFHLRHSEHHLSYVCLAQEG